MQDIGGKLLLVDEAVASRAVVLTVSGSDKRTGRQESVTMPVNGEQIRTHGRAIECAHPRHITSP